LPDFSNLYFCYVLFKPGAIKTFSLMNKTTVYQYLFIG